MTTLFPDDCKKLSRRDFLKRTGTGLLACLFLPVLKETERLISNPLPHRQGRILSNQATLYDQPSFSGKMLQMYWQDLIVPITGITVGAEEPSYNRVWYEINHQGFIHSGSVQPVDTMLNPVRRRIPTVGRLAEITVPFTDTVWSPKTPGRIAYRLYFGTTYWVNGVFEDDSGKIWYRIPDDKWEMSYYAEGRHLHLINSEEIAPLSPGIPPEAKRLEIHLEDQVVMAYEGDQPVFMTRAATGAQFSDGDFRTPKGQYVTNRKRPSRHMAAGDRAAPNSYDLPGVPWVSYLTKSGIAFHGTYWHNDFGNPRSHGCINVSSEAARWIYRWTSPHVPINEIYWSEQTGTVVTVK